MEKDKLLEIQFINLVSALAASAMQQLGKLANPLSSKMEVNLPGARATIDLLDMLKEKTRGNLSAEETNLLDAALANLQLNYVDGVHAASKPKDAAVPTPPQDPQKEPVS